MSLLLQLNADSQQFFPHDERRLHVLCCRKKTCSKKIGSVRAFREVKKPQITKKKDSTSPVPRDSISKPVQDLGGALFGSSSSKPAATPTNPFSTSVALNEKQSTNIFGSLGSPSVLAAKPPQTPTDDAEPPTTSFADKLKISLDTPSVNNQPEELWPDRAEFPPTFPQFYLDAYPEDIDIEKPADGKAGPSQTQYDMDDSTGNIADKDTFESSLDKTFQKFSDRIAQNPEQVLRYELKGQPLLYSSTDNVATHFVVPHGKAGAVRGIPRCQTCGAQRAFELQLVPGLIYELEKDDAMDLDDGMEWGTIIVGTCQNNCGNAGEISFREEWVGVQWEERIPRK